LYDRIMRLTAGTRLGPYEILAPIGAGGMGEVYRARDTRLERDVAIKCLPDAVAADPDRLARFRREARTLAALNHPHIAAVYELEEAEGVHALVMELVPGETLADVLLRGAPAVREALGLARQIAGGLEAAHESGVIHRDLKPANLQITPSGAVKILDFGLAKALAPEGTIATADTANAATLAAGASRTGLIVGTAAYMSPEQARGLPVDARTDVWAFGCVLYELLTGRRAFAGDYPSDAVAAVLRTEPEWGALPPETPPGARRLLRRCLEKDPHRRLHDIADARIELDDELNGSSGAEAPPEPRERTDGRARVRARTRERIAWALAGVSLIGLVLTLSRRPPASDPPGEARTYDAAVVLPADLRMWATEPSGRFALSPDGRRLALIGSDADGQTMLWVRPLGTAVAQRLAGTEGATFPFWSPDSRFVAFMAAGKLKKIDAGGGAVVTLCDGTLPASGTWNREDVILFTPRASSPVYRVPAGGGTPEPATRLDAAAGDEQHWFPFFLPDGRHFLYFVVGSKARGVADPRAIYLGSLNPGEAARPLIEGGSNAKFANGHVIFVRDGTLMAQRFDPDRLVLKGDAAPLVEQVQIAGLVTTGVAAAFTVSETGVLAYQTGSTVLSQLAWLDREGRELAKIGEAADYGDLALSPDGTRAAVSVLDPAIGTRDIWLFDLGRGLRQRVTFNPGDDIAPVWSKPEGDRLFFSSRRQGRTHLYERPLRGAGDDTLLFEDSLGKYASSLSPDGRFLAYVRGGGIIRRSDVWMLPLAGERRAVPLLQTEFIESQPQISPDGQWLAYMTNESGRHEVYIRPFARDGDKVQVSTAGGGWPRWRRDGKEIFYLAADRAIVAVPVARKGLGLEIGAGRRLFTMRTRPQARLDAYNYDVSPDGRRFLVNTFIEQTTSAAVNIVINWPASLAR
jgi:Tol biopolymer transport system component